MVKCNCSVHKLFVQDKAQDLLNMSVLPHSLPLQSKRPDAGHTRPPCLHCRSAATEDRFRSCTASLKWQHQAGLAVVKRGRQLALCQATAVDPQQQDVDSMDEATKRWGQQVREGKVKSINTKSAGEMVKNDWTLLDVRPQHEVDVASIQGAVNVPLFVVDEEVSFGTFVKKAMAFTAMGGWWEGGTHMIPNTDFVKQVEKKIPKDRKIVVACQKGLRSLAASERLSRAGYPSLAWINGGLQTAKKGDLPVLGAEDVRLAGIGGLSSVLGWTEVQQQSGKGFLGGSNNLIRLAVFVLLIDFAIFVYEQGKYYLGKGQ